MKFSETLAYIPHSGDIVWIMFNPQAGCEQAEPRPALVLSPKAYNGRVGLAILCPITSQVKGYPFEFLTPEGLEARGAILSDQVKSLDRKASKAQFIWKLPPEYFNEVVKEFSS